MNIINKIQNFTNQLDTSLPSITNVETFTDGLIHFLFPIRDKSIKLDKQLIFLKKSLLQILSELQLYSKKEIEEIEATFFNKLPEIFDKLIIDAENTLNFDPAAKSIVEIINAYPGFYATAVYRLAHEINLLNIPYIARIMSEYAHRKTGIDIHPGAQIGNAFFIDHGTGVVIGETTTIGNNVKIYQGVTLGALNVAKKYSNTKRHPTIKDDVIIYSGATILGGNTIIGEKSIIGGNVWLTQSVLSNSIVLSTHEIKIRNTDSFKQDIDYSI